MQVSNQKVIKHLLYLYWDYATNIYLFKAKLVQTVALEKGVKYVQS